ncbi:MAG: methylenetetrahydrofolate reductase [Pseudomonadota bacterium]|nr:methylenetetrahydrofolate reductase [Pseudomonadota bacterium]
MNVEVKSKDDQDSIHNWKSGSNLERILAEGHFAVTGELGPPKSMNTDLVRKKIGLLKGYVDAANITDNQTGIVRLSSIASGILLEQEGLEAIIQMTCRDRNRLAIQSDLLGANIHGIKNVLCLSGDHQSFGNHPGAKNVHDLDSMQLIRMVQEMRDLNKFQGGDEIKGGGPRLFIGAAASPFSSPIEMRPFRLAKKVVAGADFIQTQMIFDMDIFKKYMRKVVELGLHEKISILAGVGPLKSTPMARFLQNEVPGIEVPAHLLERMDNAVKGIDKEDKEARRDAWRAEGIKLCIEQIQEIREIEGVAGVHIMAIEWEAAIKPIVEGAGLMPRPLANSQ